MPGVGGNGATVCRSGTCSVNGACEPAGGCNVDADCATGNWCNETTHSCTPQLPNGAARSVGPEPYESHHQRHLLCQAGVVVCQSGVCDTNNNECGYANGDGPCTPASGGGAGNGSVVCQSGACDPDGNCGYANGDGPCVPGAAGNGATVCRSGLCSINGECEPAGGCNVDSDCATGMWCDESIHTCEPQVANGGQMPTDTGHVTPVLNGTCNPGAATLVCQSGVCDGDNRCGYANGDGTCAPPSEAGAGNGSVVCRSGVCDPDTKCGYANGDGPCVPSGDAGAGNGGVVCRSSMCSQSGTCEPGGGCNEDADCAGGMWCNESLHTCEAKLANGAPVPTDSAHTNPTLDGMCTPAAGALVCQSGVCDTKDNECGYANGDGPCSDADGGAAVCRSGTCSQNGTCEPPTGCNTNADCTDPAKPICDPGTHTCVAAADAGSDAGPPAMDSGAPEAGPSDTGAPDATTEDSGTDARAEAAEADAADSGYVEGGGCAVAPTEGHTPSAMAGWLVAFGIALGARRRARRKS